MWIKNPIMGKNMDLAGLPREAGLLILLISFSFVLVDAKYITFPTKKQCRQASPKAADPYPRECGRFRAPSRRTPYIVGGQSATWGQIPWQVWFAMKLSSRSGIAHGAYNAISHDVVIHVDRHRKIVPSCLTRSQILSLEMFSAREKCVCEESLVNDFATGCDLPILIVNNRDIASGRNMRHERIRTDCVRKCDNLFLLLTRHKPPYLPSTLILIKKNPIDSDHEYVRGVS